MVIESLRMNAFHLMTEPLSLNHTDMKSGIMPKRQLGMTRSRILIHLS